MLRWTLLCLAYLVLSERTGNAAEYRLLDIDKLELQYYKLNPNNRDPYAPQYTGRWRERAAINWDATLAGMGKFRLFWNHHIHTETIDSGAVKTVGWKWDAGVALGCRLRVGHAHHSRHIMDERVENATYGDKQNQFPVEDSFTVTVSFLDRSCK